MNYQEIVNRIQDITNQHKMLADFGYGDLSDLKVRFENTSGDASVQADYPYLFLNPGVHGRNGGVVTYNFNMIVMDMARGEVSDQPYNNMLAIQSQCQQYIDDVIAYLHDGFKDTPDVIYTGVTYTPFNERFQDEVSGMTATLTIEVPQPINNCITPFEPAPVTTIFEGAITTPYAIPTGNSELIPLQSIITDTYNGWEAEKPNMYQIPEGTWEEVITITGYYDSVNPIYRPDGFSNITIFSRMAHQFSWDYEYDTIVINEPIDLGNNLFKFNVTNTRVVTSDMVYPTIPSSRDQAQTWLGSLTVGLQDTLRIDTLNYKLNATV